MAMGRPRSKTRAGWPDNLYPNRGGFKYRHPRTRKETWMGLDRAKAFAAARKLNALLVPSGDLVDRVVGAQDTVGDAVKVFRDDDVPGRKWSPKTAEVYESVIRRIDKGLGERALSRRRLVREAPDRPRMDRQVFRRGESPGGNHGPALAARRQAARPQGRREMVRGRARLAGRG